MNHEILPSAALHEGTFVGRVWLRGTTAGPAIALFQGDQVYDITSEAPTMSALLERSNLPRLRHTLKEKKPLCFVEELLEGSRQAHANPAPSLPCLLAPCDLQVIKACGVTFAVSALERVVEERTRGNPRLAEEIRRSIQEDLAQDFHSIVPGSPDAAALKQRLESLHLWSQYLEVAFGPDAEVFTKSPPLAAVGCLAEIGIHRMSVWNNPEPEVVLAVNSRGDIVGATLGNDVNLRDVEGRSALLLGKAKDNNGSCAIGPAIRLFDESYSMEDVRATEVSLEVIGPEGFRLEGLSSMSQISRDPTDLVRQTMGLHHQYPDGMMLFLGTLFAPVQDREEPGLGFTHRPGDLVTISAPGLGALVNTVNYSDAIPPWTFGITQLFDNLQRRGLLTQR